MKSPEGEGQLDLELGPPTEEKVDAVAAPETPPPAENPKPEPPKSAPKKRKTLEEIYGPEGPHYNNYA